MANKILYLIRGLSGDGKTSLAGELVEQFSSFANDDMPGIYLDGVYQKNKSKEAQDWCLTAVTEALGMGYEKIAVHNTFDQVRYMEPYISVAQEFGYIVKIVHAEATIFPNGKRTKSTHDTPVEIIEAMRDRWQPFNFPQRSGMTFADYAKQMDRYVWIPDFVVFDFDNTLATTDSGKEFALNPTDVKATNACNLLHLFHQDTKIFIASNQRGIEKTHITVSGLKGKVENWWAQIAVRIERAYFATGRESNQCLIRDFDSSWSNLELTEKADKPNTGIF